MYLQYGYRPAGLSDRSLRDQELSIKGVAAVAELARNFSWGKTQLWSSGARRLASGAHRLAGHHQRRSRSPALGPGPVPRSSAAGQPGRLWPRRLDATMLQSEEPARIGAGARGCTLRAQGGREN